MPQRRPRLRRRRRAPTSSSSSSRPRGRRQVGARRRRWRWGGGEGPNRGTARMAHEHTWTCCTPRPPVPFPPPPKPHPTPWVRQWQQPPGRTPWAPAPPERAGPQLDLPSSATPEQLETLLNGLVKAGKDADEAGDERLPYAFYINDQASTRAPEGGGAGASAWDWCGCLLDPVAGEGEEGCEAGGRATCALFLCAELVGGNDWEREEVGRRLRKPWVDPARVQHVSHTCRTPRAPTAPLPTPPPCPSHTNPAPPELF
jgi:hypothetical protein